MEHIEIKKIELINFIKQCQLMQISSTIKIRIFKNLNHKKYILTIKFQAK